MLSKSSLLRASAARSVRRGYPAPERHVLVVDDSRLARSTLKQIIQDRLVVREEPDGEAGWQAIENDPSIVLVFSDLDMPKLDGYRLIERIRTSDERRIRDLPVVVYSSAEHQEESKARKVGASEFISKSADAADVLSRIETALKKAAKAKVHVVAQPPQRAVEGAQEGPASAERLLGEGRAQFASARNRRTPLSVMALRIENYRQVAESLGGAAAEKLMAQIATAIGTVPLRHMLARLGPNTFVLILPDKGGDAMDVLSRRLQQQIANVRLKHHTEVLRLRAGVGISSLGFDSAERIEDLIRLATQRALSSASAPDAAAKAEAIQSELSPGERSILVQMHKRFLQRPDKWQDVNALMSGWPPAHHPTYRAAYEALRRKGLVLQSADAQTFSMTDLGLKALRTTAQRKT